MPLEQKPSLPEYDVQIDALPVRPRADTGGDPGVSPMGLLALWREDGAGQTRQAAGESAHPHSAGVHWSNTWSTFERAFATYDTYRTDGIDGVGFVLTVDDPFVGIDLDHCVSAIRGG